MSEGITDYARMLVLIDDVKRLEREKNLIITCRDLEMKDLRAENARLKAEVERLKEGNDCLDKMHEKEMERSAYLCEEVNRTTAWGRGLESDLSHARVEISFLKAENERLKKPAIIGGYNISEYIRMANSETLEFDNGDIFADMTLPERIKYIVESHARLKAEVQRLKAVSTIEQRTIQGLQQTPEWSEIARLTADYRALEAENARLRASSFVTAVPVEEYEKLKAELERIYKLDPLLREAIASAVLASKEGRP